MADATLRFLGDTAFRLRTRRRAYRYARPMFWPNVGQQYLEVFTRVAAERRTSRQWIDRNAPSLRWGEHLHSELMQGGL